MTMGWWGGLVLASGCLAGCYRSAHVSLDEARSLGSDGDSSLVVEREGGGSERFPEFDELTVEVEREGVSTELTLKTPLAARLDAKTLRLVTPEQSYELMRHDVPSVTLQQYAPGRPYIIAGASLGAMLLGFVVGASTVSCAPDEDLCGLG